LLLCTAAESAGPASHKSRTRLKNKGTWRSQENFDTGIPLPVAQPPNSRSGPSTTPSKTFSPHCRKPTPPTPVQVLSTQLLPSTRTLGNRSTGMRAKFPSDPACQTAWCVAILGSLSVAASAPTSIRRSSKCSCVRLGALNAAQRTQARTRVACGWPACSCHTTVHIYSVHTYCSAPMIMRPASTLKAPSRYMGGAKPP